jgi:hypothetical protein
MPTPSLKRAVDCAEKFFASVSVEEQTSIGMPAALREGSSLEKADKKGRFNVSVFYMPGTRRGTEVRKRISGLSHYVAALKKFVAKIKSETGEAAQGLSFQKLLLLAGKF